MLGTAQCKQCSTAKGLITRKAAPGTRRVCMHRYYSTIIRAMAKPKPNGKAVQKGGNEPSGGAAGAAAGTSGQAQAVAGPAYLKSTSSGVNLSVHVKPGSKHCGVSISGSTVRASLLQLACWDPMLGACRSSR